MPICKTLRREGVPVHIWTDDVDDASLDQLANIARLPCAFHHVAAMPDVHLGLGATIGSVIATDRAIIPAAVGVDIGCGMLACRVSLSANELDERSLRRVFEQISRDVPVGHGQHPPHRAMVEAARPMERRLARIVERHPALPRRFPRFSNWVYQLGTLGGGNHFIELCLDERDRVWVMLHSGSRGIGNAMASYFIELARRDMERHQMHLPDRNLAYFSEGSEYFDDYMTAVAWAQEYAWRNRQCMLELILTAMRRHLPAFSLEEEVVNCHHNYVARERHYGREVYVTRKGAIRAGTGELGIIPGSMGTRSYIVRGKGNRASFCSCAHGAGRRMSRRAAKQRFSKEALVRQTEGVICRKDLGVVDEIPAAYKDIDVVMRNQADLVEIVHTLKQVLCVKG